jgi:hypothetical protein
MQISYYGGVPRYLAVGPLKRTPETLVALQPFVQRRVTAAGCWLTEEVYRQLRRAEPRRKSV